MSKQEIREKLQKLGWGSPQIDLGIEMFGWDALTDIAKQNLSVSKAFELNTRFKEIQKQTVEEILDVLGQMPQELITIEFLDALQLFVDEQSRVLAEQEQKALRNKSGFDVYFRGLGQQVNSIKKQVDSHSIWFSGGNA